MGITHTNRSYGNLSCKSPLVHPAGNGAEEGQESLRFVLKEMPDQLGHLHIVILYADNGFKDS